MTKLTPEMEKIIELGNTLVLAIREKRDYTLEMKGHLEEAKIIKGRLPDYQKRIDEAQTAYDAAGKEAGL